MSECISIQCLEVDQPIGTFYIGSIDAKNIVDIAFADVRRQEGREIEKYIGTQRDLAESRVKEIKQYVTTVDACFPTSVILAINSSDATYDSSRGIMTIKRDRNVAKIIDGQHRIAGFEHYTGPTFMLNVTIFIDMDIEDQAMVFAIINLKQTKVSKSLAYDLYDYAVHRSPQKTCHNIAKLLNFDDKSPLCKRIKILGKATGIGPELITQAAFVDRVMRLISSDAMQDKDLLKRGKKLYPPTVGEEGKLVFRNWFIQDKDEEIARFLWNYFTAVARRWPTAWSSEERGNILPRTTGFAALIRLIPHITQQLNARDNVPTVDMFSSYFSRLSLNDAGFTSDNFKPGSSGESVLFDALRAVSL